MSVRTWLWDGNSPDWPRVLLIGLAAAVLIALGIVGATSATAFGPYNPSWDGASDLREQVETTPDIDSEFLSDTGRYDTVDPNRTVAFVIAPDTSYDVTESARVQAFVEGGGTLVVLENFGGSGGDLLADVGAQARFDGRILRDERNHFRAPTMPVATGVANHTLTEGVDQLTLNFATAVEPGNATVLVRTSEFAYLAESPSSELDDEDELAAYPVATVEPVGSGAVVVVGDPSITINVMLEQPDNAAFLAGLYEQTDRVLFDISHAEGLPPLTSALLLVRGSALVQVLVGGFGIAGVALLARWRIRPRLRRALARLPVGNWQHQREDVAAAMDDAERAAYLRRRHPEWDEERIERVMTALKRSHKQLGNDRDE